MIRAIKPSPFIKDIILTTITSVVTIFSLIMVTRLLAQGLGPEEFGAYSLARRIVSTIAPFATLAMGLALVRHIAISKDNHARYSYLLGGILLGVVPSLVIFVIGLIFSNKLATLIFHGPVYSSLLMATLFMLVGYSFYIILYAFYRGQGKMRQANLWQLATAALGPLLIAWIFAKNRETYKIVILLGCLLLMAIFPLIYLCFKALKQKSKLSKKVVKELFKYGFPRAPGALTFAGLLSIGPFLAPYFGTLKDTGYLIVGLSILRIVQSGVVAFELVALSRIAKFFADGRDDFIKDRGTDLLVFIFQIGLFVTLHLYLWCDLIILIWLGKDYKEAITLARISILALVPYLSYVMFRSVIDAIEERAINTYNLYITFIITLAISLFLVRIGLGIMGLAVGTTIGFFLLGGLTVFYIESHYGFSFQKMYIIKTIIANSLFFLLAWKAHQWFMGGTESLMRLFYAFLVEGTLFAIYMFLLSHWQVRWIKEIKKRLRVAEK